MTIRITSTTMVISSLRALSRSSPQPLNTHTPSVVVSALTLPYRLYVYILPLAGPLPYIRRTVGLTRWAACTPPLSRLYLGLDTRDLPPGIGPGPSSW